VAWQRNSNHNPTRKCLYAFRCARVEITAKQSGEEIMPILRTLLIAFAAGAVAALAWYGAVWIILQLGVVTIPAPRAAGLLAKATLYKQMVWGGIWALLLILPFLTKHWYLRGLVLGIVATIVGFLVFLPVPITALPVGIWVFALVINSIWGVVAAFIFWLAADRD
jgi:hypothetical protein